LSFFGEKALEIVFLDDLLKTVCYAADAPVQSFGGW
jgi:hypothetical protein